MNVSDGRHALSLALLLGIGLMTHGRCLGQVGRPSLPVQPAAVWAPHGVGPGHSSLLPVSDAAAAAAGTTAPAATGPAATAARACGASADGGVQGGAAAAPAAAIGQKGASLPSIPSWSAFVGYLCSSAFRTKLSPQLLASNSQDMQPCT